jgi:hypothetical protein
MLRSKRKSTLTAVFLLVILGLAPSRCAAAEKGDKLANDKPAAGLDLAAFKELRAILDIKNQPWTTIPWKYSITEARKLAAVTNKPIFMVVNTGNCLGCT